MAEHGSAINGGGGWDKSKTLRGCAIAGCACDEVVRLPEAEGRAAERSQEAERDPPVRSRATRDPTGLLPKYHSSVLNSLVITILADTLDWY